MKATILTVGNELTTGQTVDTNSSFLACELNRLGIDVIEHCTVGDNAGQIARAIVRLAKDVNILMVTGGLGPTKDDLTRQAMAQATESELVVNPGSLEEIKNLFSRRGWQMAESNLCQAMLPAGATPIANPIGTAPGIAANIGDCRVFVMPGVPAEMKHMLADNILAALPHGNGAILHRAVHTFGLGESTIGERIADLMSTGTNPSVGTTASSGQVSVRITARAADRKQADQLADSVVTEICARLGNVVVGTDQETMSSVVGELLATRGSTVATAESCSGGHIGKLISDVSGSSRYFLGGVVAYCNRLKRELLGVDEALLAEAGAVSAEVAGAMAEGLKDRLGCTYALSVTGIAGPTGATADKPVGLVYAGLAGPGPTQVASRQLSGDRQTVRLRASLYAMNMLRLNLLSAPPV